MCGRYDAVVTERVTADEMVAWDRFFLIFKLLGCELYSFCLNTLRGTEFKLIENRFSIFSLRWLDIPLYWVFCIKYTTQNYPNEISLDEQLWYGNRVGAQTFSDLFLHLSAHKHVPLHKLDQMGPQYLSDQQASLISVTDYAHGGCV